MPDLLETGVAWHETMRKTHMSRDVIYTPLATATPIALKATPGRTQFESGNDAGLIVDAETSDWVIVYADLGREPEPGDIIVWGARTYEVMPLGGEACWRYSGVNRTSIRVHTKARP